MSEACDLCVFWKERHCTQTWRLLIMVEPVGGLIDLQTSPGMVPEELKAELTDYFQKFMSRLIPAIETMPFWEEIRKFQLALPERAACPARRERQEIKPYLKVVKFEP